jgi:hypothetical protein
MRGTKKHDLELMSCTLDTDIARRANALARRVAQRTGVKLFQAKAALLETGFEMLFGGKP